MGDRDEKTRSETASYRRNPFAWFFVRVMDAVWMLVVTCGGGFFRRGTASENHFLARCSRIRSSLLQ